MTDASTYLRICKLGFLLYKILEKTMDDPQYVKNRKARVRVVLTVRDLPRGIRNCMSSLQFLWNDRPDQCGLNDSDVHVWAADLDAPAEQISAFERTLATDERDRAGRYVFARDRNRFVSGRGLLRAILGTYLEMEPAQVRFVYGPHGKPALSGSCHFNVAHCEDLLLVALTRVCPVGIDVERIRALDDAEELAVRFFSPGEIAQLKKVSKDQQAAAFFSLWTRKEAYLKATGQGISELLSQIEVSFLDGQPAKVISISGSPQAAAQWTLKELTPARHFKAALAAAAKGLQLSCWRWP